MEIHILTKTISKQVDDIGKLVDEFSSFARMPEAEIKLDNLSLTLKESFELFSNAHSKINMKLDSQRKDIFLHFDRFQITQAFNNIIKNAVEAVINIPNPSINISLLEDNNLIKFIVIDNGIGIDENNEEAAKWYQLSAEQGDSDAQNNLGAMYSKGEGAEQSFVDALKWFVISAENGSEAGRKNIDIVEKRMTPEQITKARKLAREWAKKHRENGL